MLYHLVRFVVRENNGCVTECKHTSLEGNRWKMEKPVWHLLQMTTRSNIDYVNVLQLKWSKTIISLIKKSHRYICKLTKIYDFVTKAYFYMAYVSKITEPKHNQVFVCWHDTSVLLNVFCGIPLCFLSNIMCTNSAN